MNSKYNIRDSRFAGPKRFYCDFQMSAAFQVQYLHFDSFSGVFTRMRSNPRYKLGRISFFFFYFFSSW